MPITQLQGLRDARKRIWPSFESQATNILKRQKCGLTGKNKEDKGLGNNTEKRTAHRSSNPEKKYIYIFFGLFRVALAACGDSQAGD